MGSLDLLSALIDALAAIVRRGTSRFLCDTANLATQLLNVFLRLPSSTAAVGLATTDGPRQS